MRDKLPALEEHLHGGESSPFAGGWITARPKTAVRKSDQIPLNHSFLRGVLYRVLL